MAGITGQGVYQIESIPTRRPQRETIRRLAEALGVATTYLEFGYDPKDADTHVPSELMDAYRRLGPLERRALMENARTLRELQAEYAALTEHEERRVAEDGGELEEVPDAAHPVTEEIREARKDAEDFEER